MTPQISIVVPCYNCRNTLPATVNSILGQEQERDIEVILVDDGSRDDTRALLESLRRENPSIVVLFHETNRGGGAAHNTGIARARGEYVLCFDADDLLDPGALSHLLRKVRDDNLDGAAFAGSYSFRRNPEKNRFQSFAHSGNVISIENVFDRTNWPVGVNFLYRREVHEKVGGYPEHHSFDTQAFGIRFLAHGLRAASAPGAFFFQRQFGPETSYFERAYVSGEYSVGFFLVFEELYEMLGGDARKRYLGFPIFSCSTFENNISGALTDMFAENPSGFFRTRTLDDARTHHDNADSWSVVIDAMRTKDWATAAGGVVKSMDAGIHCEVGGFMMQRILLAASGAMGRLSDLKELQERTSIRPHLSNTLRESYFQKAGRKIRKVLGK